MFFEVTGRFLWIVIFRRLVVRLHVFELFQEMFKGGFFAHKKLFPDIF